MATNDDIQRRLRELMGQLRTGPGTAGPGSGLGRLARTLRSGVGMAARVWSASGKGEDAVLDEGQLASLEGLVTRLGDLKGVPMKIGQILSYLEADLPEQMQQVLALLQTQSRPTPFAQVEAIIRDDLGARAPELLAHLERDPVSAASIGQVHRGRLPDGTDVAVKVRHPEIEAAIRSDFGAASTGTAMARFFVPGAGATAREFVAEAQARLLEECDYRLEAERQLLFEQFYAGHPDIHVPRVVTEYCGPRVLTSSWESGQGFDAFAATASQQDRDRAGRALYEVYIGTLYRRAVFHADPHPGNYLFREGGRVVVFDYGCVRVFDAAAVRAFVDLAAAVRTEDDEALRSALIGLGAAPPKNRDAFAHVKGMMRAFFAPVLERGPHRIDSRIAFDARRIARDKLALARIRLPGKLLFLFRIRFGLYSVLARLGAVADWAALEERFIAER